jgi:hypothetical protein
MESTTHPPDQPPPPPPQQPVAASSPAAAGLRALYQRVRLAPLEVVAIDAAGVAPIAEPEGDAAADAGPPPAPARAAPRYERAPLRTRAAVLDRELAGVLAAPPTLDGVHAALERAVRNLRATEAFDDVWAEIDGEPAVRERRRRRRWGRPSFFVCCLVGA